MSTADWISILIGSGALFSVGGIIFWVGKQAQRLVGQDDKLKKLDERFVALERDVREGQESIISKLDEVGGHVGKLGERIARVEGKLERK